VVTNVLSGYVTGTNLITKINTSTPVAVTTAVTNNVLDTNFIGNADSLTNASLLGINLSSSHIGGATLLIATIVETNVFTKRLSVTNGTALIVSTNSLGTNVFTPAFFENAALATNIFAPVVSFDRILVTNIMVPNLFGAEIALTNVFTIYPVAARQAWSGIACSANGNKLAATVQGGGIYVSTNAGDSWVSTSAPRKNWTAIAMSADGNRLVAVATTNGLIYTSSDSGTTWVAASEPATNWSAVASSASGGTLVAVVKGGLIYIGQVIIQSQVQATLAPTLQIHAVNGNAVLTWPTGQTVFVLQQKSNMNGVAWADSPANPVVTNGQNQVALPIVAGQYFYRLRE
jgi:hypothetical protein